MNKHAPYILMLEDDGDDRHITETIFSEQQYDIRLVFLTDPDEVLTYLSRCTAALNPLPNLIILDKNVPAGSGMDVLRAIKTNNALRHIPVVMISGSDFAAEVHESYQLGANSYIVKPLTNEMTTKKITSFVKYWFDTVELPQPSQK